VIFDARFKWRYPMGPLMPILPLWTHSRAVRSIVHRAKTLAELAGRLKIDPAALEATVERFNGQARAAHDPDFHRGEETYDRLFGDPRIAGNPNLAPIERAPFYAVAIFPGDIGTNGGLATDEAGAVLDDNGRRIAGLYATGNVTASVMGRGYPGGGSTLGPAMTFGYLAARDITGAN
jgi:3-oxosteroid 1-dehydrogenase